MFVGAPGKSFGGSKKVKMATSSIAGLLGSLVSLAFSRTKVGNLLIALIAAPASFDMRDPVVERSFRPLRWYLRFGKPVTLDMLLEFTIWGSGSIAGR